MLFNSFSFLIFFPVVTTLYFVLPHRYRWLLLLAASSFFYMAFIPVYILILACTIVIDYAAGILIESAAGKRRKVYLLMSIVTNVAFLAFFKYYNFTADNLTALAGFLHWNYTVPILKIALPIGLSFHTFQAMSYTIEVYRGRQAAERHFGIYALYVMFYPQLVAGPIERPQNLLHQFKTEHYFEYQRVTDGLKLMLWGFFKKVVIADRAAILVDGVYNHLSAFQGLPLVIATILFAFQIYCDFSGYSDIAIGSAQVMGFRLMDNFNRPYFSKSIGEFWQRWHISLSTWFRDYVYIPLGGNRAGRGRWCFNIMVVFLISGLWHGAAWTFLIWGGLHGLYLVIGGLTKKWRVALAARLGIERRFWFQRLLQTITTFVLVCFSWIFFRAKNIAASRYVLANLFRGWGGATHLQHSFYLDQMPSRLALTAVAILFMEGIHLLQRHRSIRQMFLTRPVWLRFAVYSAMVWLIIFLGEFGNRQFIYFVF